MRIIYSIGLLLVLGFQVTRAEENLFVTLNTARARPLALGGAFVTFHDDLAALAYNPAGFLPDREGFSWFLNPLGPILSVAEKSSYSDASVPVSLSLAGIGFRSGRFQCGFMPGEESFSTISRVRRDRFFDVHDYQENRNVAFGFSISLAPKVSVGAAGEWYVREGGWRHARFGNRYGVIIRPSSNTCVGLTYFDLPEGKDNERRALDRFSDETVNIGVSHTPWNWLTLAADVRNVSDEGRQKGIEPHAGVEICLFDVLHLRGGFYKEFGGDEESYTAGVGIRDIHALMTGMPNDEEWRVRLEATVILQKIADEDRRWILTSLQWIL